MFQRQMPKQLIIIVLQLLLQKYVPVAERAVQREGVTPAGLEKSVGREAEVEREASEIKIWGYVFFEDEKLCNSKQSEKQDQNLKSKEVHFAFEYSCV